MIANSDLIVGTFCPGIMIANYLSDISNCPHPVLQSNQLLVGMDPVAVHRVAWDEQIFDDGHGAHLSFAFELFDRVSIGKERTQ